MIPEDLRYTAEHEWVRELDRGLVRVGVTDHAQRRLGDVVYVGLPEPGTAVTAGGTVGEVESTKSVADLYAPLPGEVVAVNTDLVDNPGLVNTDPYGAGWMIELRLAEDTGAAAAELLDAGAYAELTDRS